MCKLINCKVAFKKQYNGKKYNWIQLAGHAGRFIPGDRDGYILKTMEDSEHQCLDLLQKDLLAPFVPSIDKIVYNEEDGKRKFSFYSDLVYFISEFNVDCTQIIQKCKISCTVFIIRR